MNDLAIRALCSKMAILNATRRTTLRVSYGGRSIERKRPRWATRPSMPDADACTARKCDAWQNYWPKIWTLLKALPEIGRTTRFGPIVVCAIRV